MDANAVKMDWAIVGQVASEVVSPMPLTSMMSAQQFAHTEVERGREIREKGVCDFGANSKILA